MEKNLKQEPYKKPEIKAIQEEPVNNKPMEKSNKMSYADQKEREKIVKRARKKVSEAESGISEIESQLAQLEAKFAAGETGDELYALHADLNKKLENAMSVWELACMELSDLTGE